MFRFSIRDLFWLTVIAALAVSWWVSREKQNSRLQRIRAQLGLRISLVDELRYRPRPLAPKRSSNGTTLRQSEEVVQKSPKD